MHAMLAVALLLILAQNAQPPTFKSGVNVVEVDVVVTDKGGRPVRGLRKEDFTVIEDGKPVDVVTFAAVDVPEAPADAEIPAADQSGAAIASNDQPEDGRVILIVLDDYHVSADAGRLVATKAIARRVIERLGHSDQAAIVATSGRTATQAEFTADKARLAAAVDTFFPQPETAASSAAISGPPRFGFVREIKARWAMDTLSNAAKALAVIPHRRKAVLLVSQGLPMSLEEMIIDQNAGAAGQAMRDFILTAQRSNVAVYTVDPCGLFASSDEGCSTAAQENLRSIAEGTGGFAVVNTNAPERGIDRMVAESGTYYLLGYTSPAPPNDGKRHRIRVRLSVPDVEVRAREGYVSPRNAPKPEPAAAPLDALIGAPIQTRGLVIRVAAVPAPVAGTPGWAVVLGIEVPAADAVRAAHIEFAVTVLDMDGKVRQRQRFSNDFTATAAVPSGWARIRSRLDLSPGRYQIRIAAAGADKTRGSVFTEVVVPKFDGDLALGGVSLSAQLPGGSGRADQRPDVISLEPLATRDFPETAPLAAEIPIRVSQKAASGSLTITTTLIGPAGQSTQIDSGPRLASAYAAKNVEVYRVPLPRTLASGSYRLVVGATAGRTQMTREIAFRIVP